MTKNQDRAAAVGLDIWKVLEDEPTSRFDHIDDLILAIRDIIAENDAANEACSSAYLFENDQNLQVTMNSNIVYSIFRAVAETHYALLYTQRLSADELGAIILDQWSTND